MPFETTRRGFLKLFGMTAGATLIVPEVGKFPSLFGAEKAFDSALGWHTVVKKRPLLRDYPHFSGLDQVKAGFQHVVGHGIQSQFPQEKSCVVGRRLRMPVLVDSGLEYAHEGYAEIVVPIPKGVDVHLGFYKASTEARQQFYDRALRMLQMTENDYRSSVKIVSVMHQPIYVRPADDYDSSGQWNGGLEVVCDCETRCMLDPDFEGWEVESEYGEVLIDNPSEIDIGVLLKCDHEIVTQTGNLWHSYRNRFLIRRG